jgi:hypothetical protein
MKEKLSNKKLIIALVVVVVLFGTVGTYIVISRLGGAMKGSPILQSLFVNNQNSSSVATSGSQASTPKSTVGTSTNDSVTVPTETNSASQFGLKIIKDGSLELKVEKGKFLEVWNKITFSANSISGVVSSSSYSKEGDSYYGTITVVVPTKEFDNFIDSISKNGKVLSLNVSSQDVTGEYVDLNSQLKVLNEQHDLLLSWLKEAKTLQDMITLRNEIQDVETSIETIKGRLNYIAFHTDFSQITISVSELDQTFAQTSQWSFIIDGLKNILYYFLESIFALLIFVVIVIPWALIGFGIFKLFTKNKKV